MSYKKSPRGFTLGSLLVTLSVGSLLAQLTSGISSSQTSGTINTINTIQIQSPTTETSDGVDDDYTPTTQVYTAPTVTNTIITPTTIQTLPTVDSMVAPRIEPLPETPTTQPTYRVEPTSELYKTEKSVTTSAPQPAQVVPPEVQKLKDITSTIETVKTTVDDSKEIVKRIIEKRIQDALNKTQSTPNDAKALELRFLRDKILNDIGSSASSTTANTPLNTKELKNRIQEDLKKIDKITAEINASASSTPAARPVRELDSKASATNTIPIDKINESLDIRKKIDDYNATNTERRPVTASNTLEAKLEETKNDVIPPTPAESAKRINKLIDVIAETVDDQSQAFKANGGDLLFKDSNNDGVSDYESINLYGIDPVAPPTVSVYEGREISPEEKILLGFDPAKSELVKIEHQNPRESTFITSAYTVEDVKLTEEKTVEIRGKALPNSFVTLYIYSTPIIVTVKADENGEWSYTLDKELENGQHTLYTASVNNSGKILARSSAIAFVKTAEAATIEPAFVELSTDAKPGILNTRDIFFIITAFVGIILIAINLIGARSKNIPPAPAV